MTNESSMPQLDVICSSLSDMVTAQAAQNLLDNRDGWPESGSIVVAPNWAWLAPKIDVGRKGRTASGDTVAMPIRLSWEDGNVILVADGATPSRGVRIVGLGHDTTVETGVLTIEDTLENYAFGLTSSSVGTNEDTLSDDVLNNEDTPAKSAANRGSVLPPTLVIFTSKRTLEASLRGLVNKGDRSHWNLINALEPFALRKLTQMNGIVAAELGEHREHATPTVLDEIAIDDLLAELLYGDGKTSVIIRMLERSTDPLRFQKVDPMHYFAVFIRARAEEFIRARIGDPKIGPKIRRVAAKIGATSIEEVVEKYRELYPSDALAWKRAYMALTAGAEVTAYQKILRDNTVALTEAE